MPLFLLSDGYISDSLDDGGVFGGGRLPTRGAAHRDGLLRGLMLMAIVGVLIAIALISSAIHAADGEPIAFAEDLAQSAVNAR